ncbi:MAG: hypothetical protein IPJ07_06250 [Acidobacteria bacterium]|nr:hypothetical protein [Acidobacteriota bacterium]
MKLPLSDERRDGAVARHKPDLSISYVGAIGRNLLLKDSLFGVNPNFTGFVIVERSVATSDYHALQAQFQRRLSRGLQALASYTWSHSLDYASDNSTINGSVLKVDPRTNRGPSDFDVRHAFNMALTYNLPAPGGNRVSRLSLATGRSIPFSPRGRPRRSMSQLV